MKRKPSKNRIVIIGVNRDARNRIFRRRYELKSQFSARWNPKAKIWWVNTNQVEGLKNYLQEQEIHTQLISEHEYTEISCAAEDPFQLSAIAKEMGIPLNNVRFLADIISGGEWSVRRKQAGNEVTP
ncbi:MAG: hypothetical protein G8D88_13890 [gamma proteobacterium symbiont of Ctena orbiculata]